MALDTQRIPSEKEGKRQRHCAQGREIGEPATNRINLAKGADRTNGGNGTTRAGRVFRHWP